MILFGGTFDPVHLGHLEAAKYASEQLAAPVHMLLAPQPRLRQEEVQASFAHRWAMLLLSCEAYTTLIPCDFEKRFRGATQTISTLESLRQKNQESFVWLIGSDALKRVHLWHRASELSTWLSFFVMTRLGHRIDHIPSNFRQTHNAGQVLEKPGFIYVVAEPLPTIELNATTVRKRIRQGRDIKHLVTPPVYDYIISNNIYDQKDSY